MVGTAVFLYTIVAFGVRSSSFFGTIEKAPFCFLVPEILHLECIPQAGQPGVGVPGTGVFLGDFRGSTPLHLLTVLWYWFCGKHCCERLIYVAILFCVVV
jgi:hypothetical protein